jgi:hypothetical protein
MRCGGRASCFVSMATTRKSAPFRGRLLRLAWYDDDPARRSVLKAGARWELPVRVGTPRGLRNPGGFDAEKHAMAQRITAVGYVHEPALARRLTQPGGVPAWREAMSARIAAAVAAPSSRFIRALALGDTRALDDIDWNTLRADGLTHLIAISGFHVGLVAGFFALSVRGLWWLCPFAGPSMAPSGRGLHRGHARSRRLRGAHRCLVADDAHAADDRGRGRGDVVAQASTRARHDGAGGDRGAAGRSAIGARGGVLAEFPGRGLVAVVPARRGDASRCARAGRNSLRRRASPRSGCCR